MDGADPDHSAAPAVTPVASKPKNQGLKQLKRSGHITAAEYEDLIPVARQFGVSISEQMLQQIEPDNEEDPIAAQFIPNTAELDYRSEDSTDPIGDHRHSPVKGIIHRYPDRVLLTPVHVCPVYCRFCFRREDVGKQQTISASELDEALQYIAADTDIWEVILSGGDPLVLSPRRLADLLERLRAIEHVKVIRIHTRVPVVSPEKITPQLVKVLRAANPLYMVIHTNHAQEFSSAALNACATLADAGLPLLSQTVLLKGINDKPETLGSLMRLLVENRIKPYYLHHADRAKGTGHFRTKIQQGQQIMREMRGRYSGLCQPEYVLDIPDGAGKTPVGPTYIDATDRGWRVDDYQGKTHIYAEERSTNE
ncbi:MAG: lysine-2,3-aminomutase-like protein [Gammaproteobacteria bacterium]|nr:lysine-2,3-aminomutase-like protein [Gammaproteobacteria bacterium]